MRHGVNVDCVEADDRCRGGEGTHPEDAEEGDFLLCWTLNRTEGLVWEGQYPEVCHDVESGCCLDDQSFVSVFHHDSFSPCPSEGGQGVDEGAYSRKTRWC